MTNNKSLPKEAPAAAGTPTQIVADFRRLLSRSGRSKNDIVSIGQISETASKFFVDRTALDAIEFAAEHYADRNAYYGVGVLRPGITKGRGKESDVTGIRVLYADLDAKPGKLGSYEACNEVISVLFKILGPAPFAVVDSGGGLHPYWKIEQDENTNWPDSNDPRWKRARSLNRRWGRLVAKIAADHGGHTDSVYDLSRILRIPGSYNVKAGKRVTVEFNGDAEAISLDELETILDLENISELPEDTRVAAGQVISEPDEWVWAKHRCRYVETMVEGWDDDEPTERHPWLMSQATRIATARRLGSVPREQYDEAREALVERFTVLVDTTGDRRGVHPGEIEAGLDWGIGMAASFDRTRAVHELGKHDCTNDDPFARQGDCQQQEDDVSEQVETSSGVDIINATVEPPVESTKGNNILLEKPKVPDSAGTDMDALLAEIVALDALAGEFCWTAGLGWLRWDGRRWLGVHEKVPTDAVRRYVLKRYGQAVRAGVEAFRDHWHRATGAKKIKDIVSLAAGVEGVIKNAAEFDQRPDLLNTPSGVVDLRTGDLLPHDPDLMLTRMSRAEYHPEKTHKAWNKALKALPDDVAEYMQVRYGQAVTGHAVPDDVLIIEYGDGENAKTTINAGIAGALGNTTAGGYYTLLSDRVLFANPSDHPTELMDLRGARFALVEETAEARRLNIQRLKKIVGVPQITARHIRKDDVTFDATHSLFVTSNYKLVIEESDHGTWRRIYLVVYPYRFRKPWEELIGPNDRRGDPTLRDRIRIGAEGEHEAVLAWLVAGAVKWYAMGQNMPEPPERVLLDTAEWRRESDLVLAYCEDRLVFDAGWHVSSAELRYDFNMWVKAKDHRDWSERTFTERFKAHEVIKRHRVEKKLIRRKQENVGRLSQPDQMSREPNPNKQYTAWLGVRFRTPADDRRAAVEAGQV